ncbi:MAG TPA: 1-deoxy-D-xylulose-5-phosphate reductoisomerase [Bacteroidales bacterium]|nr:1-deoxy-D-xylulose-5-phosphate reductoisomerase [Bacteroidales bacterium]
MPLKIAILGSTGSIGTQTLDVISRYPDQFGIEVLTAGDNADLLAEQSIKFHPASVVIGNQKHYRALRDKLNGTGIKVYAGDKAIEEIAADPGADMVLTAIVGYSGLRPTIAAIRSGKKIALANKETLVVAGSLISKLLEKSRSSLIPVDSEHSAIFQCLAGEKNSSVEKITLTASGGPFLNMPLKEIRKVTPGDALKHPNWNMGDKITIDSATMMNKGLEVIEAKWLFNLEPDQIKVIIHPQSIIHSFVHFTDGSVKAQLGMPDMRIPILYALSYPGRMKSDLPRLELDKYPSFTFNEPDLKKFGSLLLAYQALNQGGNMPCILNAANEVAVSSFLSGKIGFMKIPEVVEHALEAEIFIKEPGLEELEISDKNTRETSARYINKFINIK